jgi:hypothetical protein
MLVAWMMRSTTTYQAAFTNAAASVGGMKQLTGLCRFIARAAIVPVTPNMVALQDVSSEERGHDCRFKKASSDLITR